MTPEILKHAQVLWDFHHVNHTLKSCDLIFVLGSQDCRVADYAATLWHRNLAPQVMVSGHMPRQNEDKSNPSIRPEADIFAERMRAAGVPADKIWQETEATNTEFNYTFSLKILQEKGRVPRRAIVVTKPYMERRALATGLIRWPGIELLISSEPVSCRDYFSRPGVSLEKDLSLMVGDLQRLKLYPAKGFMAPTDIPDHVWASFEALVSLGFDKHLVK